VHKGAAEAIPGTKTSITSSDSNRAATTTRHETTTLARSANQSVAERATAACAELADPSIKQLSVDPLRVVSPCREIVTTEAKKIPGSRIILPALCGRLATPLL
jgi:hypothetical protein